MHIWFGQDAIPPRRDCNVELAGFLDVADIYGWRVHHVVSAHAGPGGPVTDDTFDYFADLSA